MPENYLEFSYMLMDTPDQVDEMAQGRVCVCGNVDCGLLFNGPAEEVYRVACQLLLDCKKGGGFVLGASNAVQQETPISHYEAMLRAWEDIGVYPASE